MTQVNSPNGSSKPAWRQMRRAFRIALDPRKLSLAALGLILLWCGELLIGQMPFESARKPVDAPGEILGPLPNWGELTGGRDPWGPLIDSAFAATGRILAPIAPLFEITSLPWTDSQSWPALAIAWTRFLWSLLVWSLCGTAIARLAAVEFARWERHSLWSGIRFSLARFLSTVAAPLLPIAAIFLLWTICAAGGALGHIPYVGATMVALLWGIGFILGLLVLLVVIATTVAWPLMVAGIATESSDAFDGFSRSFSYLYGRPWLFAWCVLIALALGSLMTVVVEQGALLVASTTGRLVSTTYQQTAPTIEAVFAPNQTVVYSLKQASDVASGIITLWYGLLFLFARAFALSFFWSASTVIYFVLRRADDATHFDEVWLDDVAEEDDLLPLAGVASTGQPVVERSHHPTVKFEDET